MPRILGTKDNKPDNDALNRDYESLERALSVDKFHPGTTPAFFNEPNTLCMVYEDNGDPVMFVRGTAALRVDLCFMDNYDKERNKAVLLQGIEDLKKHAKVNGFTELVGCSNSLGLMQFFREQGFEVVAGEMKISLKD